MSENWTIESDQGDVDDAVLDAAVAGPRRGPDRHRFALGAG
jgi:hypothetical protein